MSIATCNFKGEYFDKESKSNETFTCYQECLEGKDLCLFHDESYLDGQSKNKDKVIEKLYEQIENSVSKNKPLRCIGYYLPDIQVDKKITQLAYFAYCKFQNADFSEEADFFSTEFKEEALFSVIKISEDVSFSNAIFSSKANFTNTTFSEDVSFSNAIFSSKTYL